MYKYMIIECILTNTYAAIHLLMTQYDAISYSSMKP